MERGSRCRWVSLPESPGNEVSLPCGIWQVGMLLREGRKKKGKTEDQAKRVQHSETNVTTPWPTPPPTLHLWDPGTVTALSGPQFSHPFKKKSIWAGKQEEVSRLDITEVPACQCDSQLRKRRIRLTRCSGWRTGEIHRQEGRTGIQVLCTVKPRTAGDVRGYKE